MNRQMNIFSLIGKSLNTLLPAILMSMLSAYSQIAIGQEESILISAQTNSALEQTIGEFLQQSPPPESQQSDADILRSLDDFGDEINDSMLLPNDPFELQSSEPLSPINNSLEPEKIAGGLLDSLIIDDSFEQLDLEGILVDEQSNNQIITLDEITNQTEHFSKIKQQSVGINGEEEALINKLDNSDLMDFDKNFDIWDKEVLDNKELQPSTIDSDEFDLEQMNLDDIEFIDEMNDIDGVYLDEQSYE